MKTKPGKSKEINYQSILHELKIQSIVSFNLIWMGELNRDRATMKLIHLPLPYEMQSQNESHTN